MASRTRPTVAVLLPEKTRRQVLSADAERRLSEVADCRWAAGDAGSWDVDALLDGAVACLTGWGTPPLGAETLLTHRDLRLVAHTAGSVRRLVPQEVVGTQVTVCQAAALIADSVAEMVILQILSSLRELHRMDAGLKGGAGWGELRDRHPGHLLRGRTVGVVGASRTGRAVIGLLRAFGARVLVVDPVIGEDDVTALGATRVDLDTLLAAGDVVTLHAPLLPETEHLIGARELALLRDGTLFVNSARAGLVDPDALLAELRTGRIRAALDVFPTEPLRPGSEWLELPEVIVSPHSAGHTVESHLRQGEAMVDEIERFVTGRPLRYAVDPGTFAVLA